MFLPLINTGFDIAGLIGLFQELCGLVSWRKWRRRHGGGVLLRRADARHPTEQWTAVD
jgi:hypothetical protein